ncbi:MAG: hypothetical protein AB7K09_21705 [Planctomycetota bacterium]
MRLFLLLLILGSIVGAEPPQTDQSQNASQQESFERQKEKLLLEAEGFKWMAEDGGSHTFYIASTQIRSVFVAALACACVASVLLLIVSGAGRPPQTGRAPKPWQRWLALLTVGAILGAVPVLFLNRVCVALLSDDYWFSIEGEFEATYRYQHHHDLLLCFAGPIVGWLVSIASCALLGRAAARKLALVLEWCMRGGRSGPATFARSVQGPGDK